MLKTSDLKFSYTPEKSFHFPDFQVESGDHLLVLGKSGTGKTTLLHLLAGFLSPDSGKIWVDKTDFSSQSGFSKDQFRARNIGVIFQVHHFVASLNVMQNIMLAQKLAHDKPDSHEVMKMLTRLGLKGRARARISEMSQGELQRASIIRGLVNKPVLVLADEPTSSLDDDNCAEVVKLLEEQTARVGATLLVVTHDQRLKDFFTNSIEL
mgnify:CR=1 FL=1